MKELISVIMGIYDCASTISEAIDSIINQTYENWELIMCDDCSTDNTYEIACEYRERYPKKIIVIKNEKNMKLSYTLNHCLKYASGEYIARMDGDDISLPTRFQKQIEYMKTHPEYDVVGTSMRRFNEEGEGDVILAAENPDYYTLRYRNPFHHATIMAKKSVYDALGGYTVSERTVRGQDNDLWFRFYHAGFQGNNLMEPLYLMRENIAAVNRRTVKSRLNALKTEMYGYKLLGYPKVWIVKPILKVIVKIMVPSKLMYSFHKWQMRKHK